MLRFYYSLGPNPLKVALFLEEAGLPYQAVPVDTRLGDQHAPQFRALNPNGKVPVIDDAGTIVWDSTAILLYLADKTGRFLPPAALRGELLSWLLFTASGVGPFTGQNVHFTQYAPGPQPYAAQRYAFEAWRHWQIVEERLAGREWMVGDSYSILDMAVWGWARILSFALGAEARTRLPNVRRLVETINARPAAARVAELKARHAFKAELDAAAMRVMFPGNEGFRPATD